MKNGSFCVIIVSMKRVIASIIVILFACLLLACSASPVEEAEAPDVTPLPTPTQTPEPEPVVPIDDEIVIEATPETVVSLPPMPTPTPSPTPSPTPEPTPEPTPPPPLAGIVIGLDPGHQRVYDPKPEPVAPGSSKTKPRVAGGCRGIKSGAYEYDVAQAVSLHLKTLLEEQGATVVITHETVDVNISNAERAQMFNEANVDLGIRLHLNGGPNKQERGAFMLVPTENRTKFYDYNVAAAKTILAVYVEETGLRICRGDGMTYRGDQTGFNWCTRPIINIEMGHLSNVEDDKLLSDPEFQKIMAQALCDGILQFFAENGRPPEV